ncbi:MAG: tetratricopeptide repeat protein [Cyclobacteriaceae bacterium]|nr:tetratricopeptide repeat protein [Cyclobacteriaceae bacterium]
MKNTNLITEQQDLVNQLLISATKDDTKLYDLVMNYTNLISSSETSWIDYYQNKIINVLNLWRGSFKTADALYYIVTGFSFFFLTKPKEALDEFNKMFDYCDDTALFSKIKGAGYMGRGVAYRSLGMIDKTMEDCLKAVQLIDASDTAETWHIFIYRMLGEIHIYIGELQEATNYYLKAKSVMESINNIAISTARFRVNDALGNCYNEMGDKEKAEGFLRTAMEVEGISEAERARVLCDFGILYINEPQKALTYFEKSAGIRKKAHLEDAYTTSLIYKGECAIALNNLKEAKEILDEAALLVDKYDVPSKKLHFYEQCAALHEKKQDHAEALRYFHLYNDLKSKIHDQQSKNIFQIKNKLIADQHQEIETKHIELKDTLSELARIKVSRKALFFSIATVVVLVILTEVFLEPLIEEYSKNEYLGIASKIVIAFLLKPIDTLYERLLFRRAYRA